MFSFNAGGKEYKVKFGYGVLCKTDIIDKISRMGDMTDAKEVLALTPTVLLAGLQKYHNEEFGYESDSEKETAFEKVCDLLDVYEDEGTEENPHSAYDLFIKANNELEKNGFLSSVAKIAMEQEKKKKR